MKVSCSGCQGVGNNGGIICLVCGGDGEIDLTDANFRQIHLGDQIALTGLVWSEILDKLNDILDKCNDIFEKVNE